MNQHRAISPQSLLRLAAGQGKQPLISDSVVARVQLLLYFGGIVSFCFGFPELGARTWTNCVDGQARCPDALACSCTISWRGELCTLTQELPVSCWLSQYPKEDICADAGVRPPRQTTQPGISKLVHEGNWTTICETVMPQFISLREACFYCSLMLLILDIPVIMDHAWRDMLLPRSKAMHAVVLYVLPLGPKILSILLRYQLVLPFEKDGFIIAAFIAEGFHVFMCAAAVTAWCLSIARSEPRAKQFASELAVKMLVKGHAGFMNFWYLGIGIFVVAWGAVPLSFSFDLQLSDLLESFGEWPAFNVSFAFVLGSVGINIVAAVQTLRCAAKAGS